MDLCLNTAETLISSLYLIVCFCPSPVLFPTYRLHVVYLWDPRPGLERERSIWKDPLYELQGLPSEV